MSEPARARILIADDSDVCRTVLAILLKNSGFEVVSVINGREALAQLRAHSFDLVILDHDMPELNGLETLRALRGFAPQQPAVVVSGRLSDDLRRDYEALQIKGLWTKPVDPLKLKNELVALIARLTDPATPPVANTHTPFPFLGEADAALEKPVFAGASAQVRKLVADLGRIREFRSAATLRGFPGAAFLDTAVALGEEQDALQAACSPETLDAAWLARFVRLARAQDHAALLIVERAQHLSAEQQDLIEGYLSGASPEGPLAVRALAVLCTEVDLGPLADSGHFSEMLLLRAGAARLTLPRLAQRRSDLAMIAQATLRRIGATSVKLAKAARTRCEEADWPGDYLQLHRTVEIAHRLHPRLHEISLAALEEALAREPSWTTPLYHDVLRTTLQPAP